MRRKADGKGKVRTQQAARERWHDRPRGPRQDDADGGDHEVLRRVQGVRPDRRGAGREGARDHDLDGARGIRDAGAALRARRLPRPRRLREEHDHGCGADGRRDPRGERGRRPDAADARAHPARPPGRRSGAGRVHEQGRPGRRRGADRARGDGGARAPVVLRLPRGRHPDREGLGAARDERDAP